MFEELVETQPRSSGGANRKGYFIVSGLILFASLSVALVFSLFAVNLNLDMNDMDMVELVSPVDTTTPEKLPEPETAPKEQPKQQPGPAAAATAMTTRQINVARVDESPLEAPPAVSTTQDAAKVRPANGYFEVGKFDVDGSPNGISGRETSGSGSGDGSGGLGDGTVASKVDDGPPLPPLKKDLPAPKKPQVLSLGVVNGKAISLPKPAIPGAAKTVNAAGTVSVNVMIDEDGNVISANAISGHPLLRATSESAAKSAKFSPTLLSGAPTKVSGVINYHFS